MLVTIAPMLTIFYLRVISRIVLYCLFSIKLTFHVSAFEAFATLVKRPNKNRRHHLQTRKENRDKNQTNILPTRNVLGLFCYYHHSLLELFIGPRLDDDNVACHDLRIHATFRILPMTILIGEIGTGLLGLPRLEDSMVKSKDRCMT
jgi:hypothetical protein